MSIEDIQKFFRSVWAWKRYEPALGWTRIRDKETGRFVSLLHASRSTAMIRYWERIHKLKEFFPEEDIATIRRRWKERDYTEEELKAHGTSWKDVLRVYP